MAMQRFHMDTFDPSRMFAVMMSVLNVFEDTTAGRKTHTNKSII